MALSLSFSLSLFLSLCTSSSGSRNTLIMLKRRGNNDDASLGERATGEGREDWKPRNRTVMSKLRGKLWRNRSSGVIPFDPERQLSRSDKAATLPARMRPDEGGRRGASGSKDSGQIKTLYWMEYLGRYEQSYRQSPGVTRKDSDESVDSGFEQAPKAEGSETDSNSSPAQQSKSLLPSPSLSHDTEASSSYHDEHTYQLLPSNSMYDEAAFDKAFGPMKDVGRWYYSSRHQLQQSQVFPRSEKRLPDTPVEEEGDEECGPEVPVRVSSISVLEEYEQRLISRPLPPIPGESHDRGGAESVVASSHPPYKRQSDPTGAVPAARGRRGTYDDGNDTYELVQHRMRGSNPLMLGLRNVARYGWYWGPVTRTEAEEKLQGADDGTFIVRDSSDDRYLLSLSFRSQGKTLHTRIEYSNGFFSFYSFPDSDTEGYRSIVDLIEWSMRHSQAGVFCFSRGKAMGSPAVPVRLLKPLSRFNQVRSLQHYCRFVIRQSIRFDCIRQLPLPRHVHGFLEMSQF